MRLDNIFKSAATSQANLTVGRGHINGLYINSSDDTWRVTVRLRYAEGTRVLIPNMELWRFSYLSDFLFGAAGTTGTILSEMIDLLVTATAIANPYADQLASMRQNGSGQLFRIDLGSIYLSDGDELVIDFTNTAQEKLHISTFSDSRTPHELVTYEQVRDSNATYSKVQSIFVMAGNKVNPYLTDCSFKVTDSYDTFMSDMIGVFTASRLLGRFEMSQNADLGLLWSNSTGIPDDVSVQVTGADAQNATLIIVRKEYISSATSANTIKEAKKKIERVREIEAKDPQTAKALRHAGLVEGKSYEMEAAIKDAELSTKLDAKN